MKRISKGTLALFILVFAGGLLVSAPAALLGTVVASASKGQFVLANTAGTLWRGTAIPAIRQRSGNLLPMEKLGWDIDVWALFGGKLQASLRWDHVDQAQPMLLSVTYSQIELRNALLPVHAGILGELVPLLQPAQLSGQILVKSNLFTLGKAGLSGVAVADWAEAGSVLSAVNPLGNYRVRLTGAGERLDVSLETLAGALLLEGSGSFSRSNGMKFQATARAAEGKQDSLRELLNNLGPETAPGVHTLALMR